MTLLLNFIEVFVIDLTQAYRCRLLHVQYIHFRKSRQILVYCSIFYLSPVKVGCSIPGRTVCRPCIAQINISRCHLFLKFSENSNYGHVNYDNQRQHSEGCGKDTFTKLNL